MSGGVCLAHRTGCLALVQTQDAGGENVCNFVEMSGMGGMVGTGVSQWPPCWRVTKSPSVALRFCCRYCQFRVDLAEQSNPGYYSAVLPEQGASW